ncbi:cyclase family protein [Halalkalibacter urbisdiaboli]|uniref:cyclase family protein n=1 Tax=Halalkalibacter urbisdiaboli TaxID=1960589 RepID=UPI000B4432E0|nr:cyclase family protein [Halalkalibacter urbisdiaboli]
MKIIDISIPIHEGMPTYMGNTANQPKITTTTNGYITDTRLDMNIHTCTHIDAPLHMINQGETIESIGLERLVRRCKVIEVDANDRITEEDLHGKDIEQGDFLLLKTKNSFGQTSEKEFIFLAEDAAQYLIQMKIDGVGIDTLGIERSQENHPTHKGLFSNDIIIIEGLDLKEVDPGEYLLVAAPLKLTQIEAAPARVFLIEGLAL